MEPKKAKEEIEIDLGEIISVLFAKLWFVLLLGVIAGLAALVISKFVIAPIYSSSTKVYVISRQNTDANVTYTDLQTGSQLTKDYLELVKSRTVLTQVITRLDLDLTTTDLSDMITVATPTDTRIISITVNSTDAYLAQKIANDVRVVASEHIRSVMNLQSVNVVDEADVPMIPSSPNIPRNTLLGVVLGIFLAICIVVVTYVLDDSIKTPDDVERYLGVSVLGSIPLLEDDKYGMRHRNRSSQMTEDSFLEDDQGEVEEEVF